jgi:hypothetical protein
VIAGLDLSLRASALALVPLDWAPGLDWRRVIVRTAGESLEETASASELARRTIGIAEAIVACLYTHDVTKVWIEDYAYGKGDARSHQLGELGGVVKAALYREGIEFATVVASSARANLGKFSAPRRPKGAPKLPKHLRPPSLKEQVHAALRTMGAPADWTGDELDALVVANHGALEGGHGGILVPREPKPKRRKAA